MMMNSIQRATLLLLLLLLVSMDRKTEEIPISLYYSEWRMRRVGREFNETKRYSTIKRRRRRTRRRPCEIENVSVMRKERCGRYGTVIRIPPELLCCRHAQSSAQQILPKDSLLFCFFLGSFSHLFFSYSCTAHQQIIDSARFT